MNKDLKNLIHNAKKYTTEELLTLAEEGTKSYKPSLRLRFIIHVYYPFLNFILSPFVNKELRLLGLKWTDKPKWWDADVYIAWKIYPVISKLLNVSQDELEDEYKIEVLTKIRDAFQLYLIEDSFTGELGNKIEEGLELFAKHYRWLWF